MATRLPVTFASSAGPSTVAGARPSVAGKFLTLGGEKLYLRGVTYGPFRPEADGSEYHSRELVERDFAAMRASGINAIRLYTVPPLWLLDAAARYGLRAMIGLPWEQHIAFLDERKRADDIVARTRAGVRQCAGHPAVLCYAVGNEIPASILRWYGPRRVEAHLERLYEAAKREDPDGLVTYVNYPTTEYLQLPFLDLVCFNVYLEARDRLEGYLARLQNLAGDRPLVMAEIGLDSRRNGLDVQARTLEWQVRSAFEAGCAGAFVFSWTDEWHRGGEEIDDWDFGLTSRGREAKPALHAVASAFGETPFPAGEAWPRVSVVVCTHNGSGTIRECLEGISRLEYPDFETIVVDDVSSDGAGDIAREMGFRVVPARGRGLSCARNTGCEAASGEIIAYIDDDAYPDPHWLSYLAAAFRDQSFAAVGGPNLPPPGDGALAECVANAPGGPNHVLIADRVAEHLPGCNLAIRRRCLEAVGGFDPQFWVAGDDVDICWRLQERGWTLGFHPAAQVWHHRRGSALRYWKQQVGYGRAEAMLERKWPEKYNAAGHVAWTGRLYGRPIRALWRGRIYQGSWGSAPFQSVYTPAPGLLSSIFLMPEWNLVIASLGVLALLGVLWPPLAAANALLAAAVCLPLAQATFAAARACSGMRERRWYERAAMTALTAFLHVIQPVARLVGRLRAGLTPWRRHGDDRLGFPNYRTVSIWSEVWRASDDWLRSLEAALRARRLVVVRGGDFDSWDLEVRVGTLGAVRISMAIEEHGSGRQLVRFRSRPRRSAAGGALTALLALLAGAAAVDRAWVPAAALGAIALALAGRKAYEHSLAISAAVRALERIQAETSQTDRAPSRPGARPAFVELIGVSRRPAPSAAPQPAIRFPWIMLPRENRAAEAGDS